MIGVVSDRTRGPASPFSDTEAEAVTIGDDWCRLRLRPAGAPCEFEEPTLIEFQAGPFMDTVRDETMYGFQSFRDQLAQFHTSLVGEATLQSIAGFSLVLKGNGRGAIAVSAGVVPDTGTSTRLGFRFGLDQTCLPAIIAGLDRAFLAGGGPQARE